MEFAQADGENELLQTLATTAREARNAAHYTNTLVGGITALVLYGILWRLALMPRVFATVGLASIIRQVSEMSMPLLGFRFLSQMLAPVAVMQLALITWLTAKGFEDRPVS